jgi:hypothetical protein
MSIKNVQPDADKVVDKKCNDSMEDEEEEEEEKGESDNKVDEESDDEDELPLKSPQVSLSCYYLSKQNSSHFCSI